MIRHIAQRFSGLRLGTKFSIVLLIVLVFAVALSTITLWQVLQVQAENDVAARAEVLLGMINSVRSYTSDHVRPLLADTLATETDFTPERVPAFSARATFETLRQDPRYAEFLFREASLNPQNPLNRADAFESDLLAEFESNPGADELSGFRTRDGERLFYIARPLTVGSASCLECHGDPAAAPSSLIATYGDQNGFGWQEDQLIAAQVIYVPAQTVLDDARDSMLVLLAVFIGVSVGILLLINFWLKPSVISPVTEIAKIAELISEGSLDAPACADQDLGDVAARGDEIGKLAHVFQHMCEEVYTREEKLRQEVRQLRIEIDLARQDKQVEEITGSDYFQSLQAKAKHLRGQRRQASET